MTHVAGRLPHELSLRLSERQYRHLVAQATLGEHTMSEAARQALDRDIASQPRLAGDVSMSYATLLDSIQLEAASEQLRDAGLLTEHDAST